MPLWTIYHPDTTFTTQAEKDSFAAAITASYTVVLPAFYVVVTFIPLPAGSFYRSGKPVADLPQPFVRLVVNHLARHAQDYAEGEEFGFERGRLVVDRAIQTHIVDKGYLFEYTVAQDDRRLWKIDGLVPPPFESEAMRKWKEEDRVSQY